MYICMYVIYIYINIYNQIYIYIYIHTTTIPPPCFVSFQVDQLLRTTTNIYSIPIYVYLYACTYK